VNRKLRRTENVGILKTGNGDCINTEAGKADILNKYFSSVNTVDNNINPPFKSRVNESVKLDNILFNPVTLIRLCKKVKPKLSTGPDGYPPYLLKQIIPSIAYVVCDMYQSFMSVGKVPLEWKMAIITPLYKKVHLLIAVTIGLYL